MEKIRMFIRQILQSVQYRAWMLWQWIKENKKTFFVRTTLLAVIIVSIFWFFFRTYHNYEVIDSMKRQSDMSANYFFTSYARARQKRLYTANGFCANAAMPTCKD